MKYYVIIILLVEVDPSLVDLLISNLLITPQDVRLTVRDVSNALL